MQFCDDCGKKLDSLPGLRPSETVEEFDTWGLHVPIHLPVSPTAAAILRKASNSRLRKFVCYACAAKLGIEWRHVTILQPDNENP